LSVTLLTASALIASAQDVGQILAPAQKVYNAEGAESGNQAVRKIIESNPGNTQLALAGLRLILQKSHSGSGWHRYVSKRLISLNELGVLSWYENLDFEIHLAKGACADHMKERRQLTAKLLVDELKTRHRGSYILKQMIKDLTDLKPTYRSAPAPTGSPLPLIVEAGLEDRLAELRDADPADIAETIDKLIEKAVVDMYRQTWDGNLGNLEEWAVIDTHLRRQTIDRFDKLTADNLGPLRAYQEKKLQEDPDNLTADALRVFRRFPWAETAHRRLLDYGSMDLTRGRVHAAYRSFDDVRTHSADADLRKRAADGCKLALSNMEKTESQAPDLEALKIQAVVPPPIRSWNSPKATRRVYPELQVQDDHVVLSARRYLAAYARNKTDFPKWLRKDDSGYSVNAGGEDSYGPALIDGKVYARNRGRVTSQVINAIDLASGSDLWTMGRYGLHEVWRRQREKQKLGDAAAPALDDWQRFLSKPLLADGLLIYLSTEHSRYSHAGYDSLVAVDPENRRVLWRSPIKFTTEELIRPYLCGISPIVHKGFLYTVSSAQAVSCHDLRDGRPVWTHRYKPIPSYIVFDHNSSPRYAGLPVIVGKRLICSPLDNYGTIALDLETGRPLWNNPYTLPVEQIGKHGDTVLVRDELSLAALSVDDGKIRWSHTFEESIVGRVQLIGDRVYVATEREMIALSAKDGTLLGKRQWELKDGPPQAVRIDGDRLFVVGNTPYLDPAKRVFNPNAPMTAALKFPLKLAWELRASYNASLMVPPSGSPLAGKMYYLDAGILTCVEANPQGGIVWQQYMSKLIHKQPIFFGELMVLRGERELVAFDGRTGERRWSRKVSRGTVQNAGDYILVWSGSNGNGRAVCLDLKTGKVRWEKTFRECQSFAQANVIHFFQRPHKKPLRHFVVNPQTGETIRAYEDILQEAVKAGRWWTAIRVGARGALLGSVGKGKPEYRIYKLDGKKPKPCSFGDTRIAHVIASNDKYIVVEEHGPQLAVYNFEDDGYRATPLAMAGIGFDRNNMYFELHGERLICVRRGQRMILFDLQAKKIIHDSDVKESQRLKNVKDKNKSAAVCLMRDGNRMLVLMRPRWGVQEAAPSYFVDLQTGSTTESPGSVLWTSGHTLRYSNGLIHFHKTTTHTPSPGHSIQFWSPEE